MALTSVLLTIKDREPEVLLSCLRSLARSDLREAEIVIARDSAPSPTLDYSWARQYAAPRFSSLVWHEVAAYEAYRIAGAFNGPSRAFNEALLASSGERLIVMSSDVLVTPLAARGALKWDLAKGPWTPRVLDLDTESEYCGPNRLFPMPWFLVVSRDLLMRVGGWDEMYLKGMCYEDNDLLGRLVLAAGGFACDWTRVVYHQSHPQPAYDMQAPEIREANERNRQWTMLKWGGVPFDARLSPFDVVRHADPSGILAYRTIEKTGKLDRAIAMSTGIVKDRLAAPPEPETAPAQTDSGAGGL